MLFYSLLHLTGYDLPIEELRISANGEARLQAILNMDILLALKLRPDRWGRGLPMALGWRWLKRIWLRI